MTSFTEQQLITMTLFAGMVFFVWLSIWLTYKYKGQRFLTQRLYKEADYYRRQMRANNERPKDTKPIDMFELPGSLEVTSDPIQAAESWAACAYELGDRLRSIVQNDDLNIPEIDQLLMKYDMHKDRWR